MATYSNLLYLVNGLPTHVDLLASGNILKADKLEAVTDIKIGSATLTAADLALLIGDGDASATHHHDGRYSLTSDLQDYVEANAKGANLVAVERKTYANITGYDTLQAASLANYNIQSIIDAINNALATAGGTEFADNAFRINDNGDPTKQIAFEASAITTGTVRTVTMPDANVDLGKVGSALQKDGSVTPTANLPMGSFKLTGLAAGTANGDSVRYEQLTALESLIQNFEFVNSALDYIVDNTLAPPTEVSGDRYVLSHDGGAPHANWDGAAAGDIVQFNGTSWVATTPTTGMMISIDDEATSLRQWSGSAWSQKYFESTTASLGLEKVGFDIRIASGAAGDGIALAAGVLSVDHDGQGLIISGGQLALELDGSTLSKSATGLKVAALGITSAELAASAVTTAKIADDAVDKSKIAADVAGAGLDQNVDGSLEVKVDNESLEIATDTVQVKLDAISKLSKTANGLDVNLYVESVSYRQGTYDLFARKTIQYGTWAAPTAVTHTADLVLGMNSSGELIKMQADSLANCKGLVGISLTAIDDSSPFNSHEISLSGRCAVVVQGGGSLTVGERVYLSASNAGQVTQTAPSATGNVVYFLGVATGAAEILFAPQLVAVIA